MADEKKANQKKKKEQDQQSVKEKSPKGKKKESIHPEVYDTVIKCACGNEIKTKSTKKNIRIEICSKCHPFYTGQQKLVDTAGRIDKFIKKYGDYITKIQENKS